MKIKKMSLKLKKSPIISIQRGVKSAHVYIEILRFMILLLVMLLWDVSSVFCVEIDITNWEIQSAKHSYSIQEVTTPVKKGQTSMRFEVRAGDVWQQDKERGAVHLERSEVAETTYRAPFNQNLWYRFSTRIPATWPDEDIRCIIAQWHATPDTDLGEVLRSPPLGIEFRNNRFKVRICHSNIRNQESNSASNNKTTLYFSDEFSIKGVWHEFLVNVLWSHSSAGYLNLWINGHQVIRYKGPLGYNDVRGPYFKFGIYRDRTPSTYVIYHDEYQRGMKPQDIGLTQEYIDSITKKIMIISPYSFELFDPDLFK